MKTNRCLIFLAIAYYLLFIGCKTIKPQNNQISATPAGASGVQICKKIAEEIKKDKFSLFQVHLELAKANLPVNNAAAAFLTVIFNSLPQANIDPVNIAESLGVNSNGTLNKEKMNQLLQDITLGEKVIVYSDNNSRLNVEAVEIADAVRSGNSIINAEAIGRRLSNNLKQLSELEAREILKQLGKEAQLITADIYTQNPESAKAKIFTALVITDSLSRSPYENIALQASLINANLIISLSNEDSKNLINLTNSLTKISSYLKNSSIEVESKADIYLQLSAIGERTTNTELKKYIAQILEQEPTLFEKSRAIVTLMEAIAHLEKGGQAEARLPQKIINRLKNMQTEYIKAMEIMNNNKIASNAAIELRNYTTRLEMELPKLPVIRK
ncbi:MAG: hypothetical protein R3B45_02490 [Bdellovibrionota bacterium]